MNPWRAWNVAREFEEGTHRLSWTQSVSRRRWLAVHMAWTFVAAIVLVAVMTVLTTWWYSPINSAQHNRLGSAVFDSQGLVPIGYTVCAVALGVATGALLRRSVPAMGYDVARDGSAAIRDVGVFAAALTLREDDPRRTDGRRPGTTVRWLGPQPVHRQRLGQPVPLLNGTPAPSSIPAACRVIETGRQLDNCLDAHGFHYLVAYQPSNHFWELQGVETALFIAIGILFVGFSFGGSVGVMRR